MVCCGSRCEAVAHHFNAARATADLDRYRRKGLDTRARRLVASVARTGIGGSSVLDVGGGAGLLTFALLGRGAARAVLADASRAYLDAARAEATRAGLADRMRFAEGDFTAIAGDIESADIVVLDRVVCCDPAWRPLLESAADHCQRVLAVTYPRNRPDVRAMIALENWRRRRQGDPFRAFVHRPGAMHAALEARGLRRIRRAGTLAWRIDLYARSR